MAFKFNTPEETAALAARTPREVEVDSAKERFLRLVKGLASDMEARRMASTSLKVITMGEHVSASFGAQVKDWDGKVRTTSLVTMPFREDGDRITSANSDGMRVAYFWSSRSDREEHRNENGLDPKVGMPDMRVGTKVTLIGRERRISGKDGRPDEVVFEATRARAGEHSWNDMMTVDRNSLEDFVTRYVQMRPESYRPGVVDAYAQDYVSKEEARAARDAAHRDGAALGSKGPASAEPHPFGAASKGNSR